MHGNSFLLLRFFFFLLQESKSRRKTKSKSKDALIEIRANSTKACFSEMPAMFGE